MGGGEDFLPDFMNFIPVRKLQREESFERVSREEGNVNLVNETE
jgi:hypothetical protein